MRIWRLNILRLCYGFACFALASPATLSTGNVFICIKLVVNMRIVAFLFNSRVYTTMKHSFRKSGLICFSIVHLFFACNKKGERNIDELCLSKSVIRVCESQEVYKGVLFDVFPNTDQQSFRVEIENGIPDGNWSGFGYEGEVIQSGTHLPVYDLSGPVDWLKFSRGSFITLREGGFTLRYLDLIMEDRALVQINVSSYKEYFERQLRDRRLLGAKDTLYSIKCCTFEGDWFDPE